MNLKVALMYIGLVIFCASCIILGRDQGWSWLTAIGTFSMIFIFELGEYSQRQNDKKENK